MMQMCIFRPLSAQVIHSSMTFCQQRQQGALLYAAHFLRLLGVVLARNPCLMADTVRLALQLRQLIEKRRVLGSLFRSVSRLPQTLHPTYSADNGHMHKGMSEMKMGKKENKRHTDLPMYFLSTISMFLALKMPLMMRRCSESMEPVVPSSA